MKAGEKGEKFSPEIIQELEKYNLPRHAIIMKSIYDRMLQEFHDGLEQQNKKMLVITQITTLCNTFSQIHDQMEKFRDDPLWKNGFQNSLAIISGNILSALNHYNRIIEEEPHESNDQIPRA